VEVPAAPGVLVPAAPGVVKGVLVFGVTVGAVPLAAAPCWFTVPDPALALGALLPLTGLPLPLIVVPVPPTVPPVFTLPVVP
jgi:hypothetical protein